MSEKAFQDFYEGPAAVCYGCGPLNEQGHHVRSFWEGEESVCRIRQVEYLRPTPIDAEIELRSRVTEIKGRKVVVATTLSANGQVCVRGEVIAIQAPDSLFAPPA